MNKRTGTGWNPPHCSSARCRLPSLHSPRHCWYVTPRFGNSFSLPPSSPFWGFSCLRHIEDHDQSHLTDLQSQSYKMEQQQELKDACVALITRENVKYSELESEHYRQLANIVGLSVAKVCRMLRDMEQQWKAYRELLAAKDSADTEENGYFVSQANTKFWKNATKEDIGDSEEDLKRKSSSVGGSTNRSNETSPSANRSDVEEAIKQLKKLGVSPSLLTSTALVMAIMLDIVFEQLGGRISQAIKLTEEKSFRKVAIHGNQGTVLAFQLLSPIFTNQGNCDSVGRSMTAGLVALCGVSCFLLSFTDSFSDKNGNVSYGFATFRGLWIIDGSAILPTEEAAKYRLQFPDFMHAFMAILVFATVALFDQNVIFQTQSASK
ncbi:hypothetical protein FNV43_RR06654 [Rhamnella rubrinervis]|uniref:Uncharacterized protein n=1 Tax=Rhamnella rubrinervis TaxID=2594499 RepID=A0A8K0HDY3_9ROSA|nr:hypothetical protein FNV43_RR06654 [Rhamnella rubrinervis]